MPARKCLIALLTLATALPVAAQVLGPQPSIHEGKDAATETDYALLSIPAEPAAGANPATLTIQCSQAGKHRQLDLFLDPGGAPNDAYRPPEAATDTVRFPIVKIAMSFDGYKTLKLQWEQRPSGEFHYMNPSGLTSNLEGPLYLMQWMFNTRITRFQITKTSPQLEFHDSNLVEAARKNPLCAP
jgi:hypothetical protein